MLIMIYKDNLRKEVTPSRLLSFLNLVIMGNYTREALKSLIYPPSLTRDSNADFNRIFNFAMDINLVAEEEHRRIGFIKNEIIKIKDNEIDEDSFKKYMNRCLFYSRESLFWRITNSLIRKDASILKSKTSEDLIKLVYNDVHIDREDILAWRFWAKYLGYAYNLMDEFIIVNPFKYIAQLNKEILRDEKPNEEMMFGKYMTELKSRASVLEGCTNGNNVSFPISLALVTLHNNQQIELLYNKDSREIWHLENMKLSGKDQVSHIRIGG
jgi:hypothetical protein